MFNSSTIKAIAGAVALVGTGVAGTKAGEIVVKKIKEHRAKKAEKKAEKTK